MSPDLPELAWPEYRRTSLRRPLPFPYFDKRPVKFVSLILEIVRNEGPVHFDVISERLSEFGGLGARDRRPNRIVLGATHHGLKDGLLGHDGDFWFLAGARVQPRNRRRAEGLAAEARYISTDEIADGLRRVQAFCPTRSVGEWTEITSRSFGFDRIDDRFVEAITSQLRQLTA